MRARRVFYEGLASLLDAGIPVRAALDQLAAQAGGDFGEALRHLRDAVDRGRTVADAMEERPGTFRRFEVELVRAAETSGTLDRTARALAADEEAADRVRRRLLSTLAYPVLVLHGAAIPLNIGSLMQGRTAAFFLGCLAWLVPLWVLGGIGWWFFRAARRGGAAGRVLLAVPVLGGMVRDAALLRWARTFAALEDAGVAPEPCALRAAAATGYAALEEPLAAPAARLRSGGSRAEAFARAPLPAEMYAALSTGEASGSIASSLRKVAEVFEHRLTTRTDAALAMAPVAATVVAGIVVLLVAVKILGGYYGMAGG
jgi:type II secretory pathway component PulF